MKIKSCKGDYEGDAESCLSWLNELQPALAHIEVGELRESLDINMNWEKSLRYALVEMSHDIDGGESSWQQYLNNDQLADVIAEFYDDVFCCFERKLKHASAQSQTNSNDRY
jgi:hypothetical protein